MFRDTDASIVTTDLETEYEILGELGRGGMAVVYRARDRELGREVAIKVIRPKFAEDDDEAVARLAREARTVAQLQHPNIVTLYAVRRLRDGGLALVMQLVPGRSLRDALDAKGPFTFERADRVLRDVAAALAHAHERGIVHRDVKPENIFLDENTGRALLSDFGVARSLEADSRLTVTGMAIGTPAYMSPEQIDGTELDGRSDLYSLGLVGWEMIAGRRPWEGEGLYNVIYKQKREDLPPLDEIRPDTPDRLLYLIEGAIRKRPEERWDTASDLLERASMISPPGGWARWRADRRKRRRSQVYADARDRGGSVFSAALETVRFRRGVPVGPAADPPSADVPATAIPTPEAPVAPQRSRWPVILVATVALLAVGATAAGYYLRARPGPNPQPPGPVFADRPGIELPVTAVPAADSPIAAARPTGLAESTAVVTAPADDHRAADSRIVPGETERGVPTARSESAEAAARQVNRGELAPPSPRAAGTGLPEPTPFTPGPVTAPPAAPSATPIPSQTAPTVDGSITARASAVAFSADRGTVAAGGRHSCLIADGRAMCWGANDQGQLGVGTRDDQGAPAPVAGELGFSQLTAGASHTCGVTADGDAYCWGSNDRGQLGDATTLQRDTPVRVGGSWAFRFVRAGLSHSCGLTRQGEVVCWGSNAYGQLGTNGGLSSTKADVVVGGRRFGALATGWNHTCAITIEGALYCWGANNAGQVGDGSRDDRRVPTIVATTQRFVAVAAGNQHTCGVSSGGDVYCWGRNNYGQLGTGPGDRSQPGRLDGAGDFVSVTAGAVHTCGRTAAGQVFCWGRNSFGQLGDGTTADRHAPTRVAGLPNVVTVQATGAHTCAATAAGATYCWGYNVEGQLGDGTRNHQPRPARVSQAR